MKKLILAVALVMGGALQAATIQVEARTKFGGSTWFMPTNHDSAASFSLGQGFICTNLVKGKSYQLICKANGNTLLIYQDKTPQKDATIATPNLVIKITTLGK